MNSIWNQYEINMESNGINIEWMWVDADVGWMLDQYRSMNIINIQQHSVIKVVIL
jgi:hypothetical protein